MAPLAGKRILVSGAGSGIGRSAARCFHEAGAELILIGRRPEALAETLADTEIVALDHANDWAVAEFASHCPRLDGMLLAAGQLATGSVISTPVEEFDRMIAANLRGPWLLCHHLGPLLKDGGSVVLVGSNIGIRALGDSAAYGIAKAGVHMLAHTLALEWADRGIRCNAIAPGPVHTAMVDERLQASRDPEGDLARLSRVNPMQRLGHPEEIAQLALHLLSDASAWTTGTIIPIDGGATAVF